MFPRCRQNPADQESRTLRLSPGKERTLSYSVTIRRTKAGEWIQRSLIAFPPAKAKSFRLTIVVNFAVNVKPRLLLVRCEVIQYFHNVTDHFLTNSADQSRAFRRDADHHFAAVISRGRAHHVSEDSPDAPRDRWPQPWCAPFSSRSRTC